VTAPKLEKLSRDKVKQRGFNPLRNNVSESTFFLIVEKSTVKNTTLPKPEI
jgi:hypothetical protein